MEEQENNSIIPIGSNALNRVSNSIAITDKIIKELSKPDLIEIWNSFDDFWKFVLYDNYVNKDLYDAEKWNIGYTSNKGTKKVFIEYQKSGVKEFNRIEINKILEIKSFIYNKLWYYDNSYKDLGDFECVKNNFSRLSNLKYLTKVDIETDELKSIHFLDKITSLQNLRLRTDTVIDFEPLNNVRNLKVLNLEWNNSVNITSITKFYNLSKLNLNRCKINDISPISKLEKLTELEIIWNNLSDIKPLSNLVNLLKLNLIGNKFNNVEPLSSLIKLEDLDLRMLKIQDFRPLLNLHNLSELKITYWDKIKLKTLKDMKSLNKLTIDLAENYSLDGLIHQKEILEMGNLKYIKFVISGYEEVRGIYKIKDALPNCKIRIERDYTR